MPPTATDATRVPPAAAADGRADRTHIEDVAARDWTELLRALPATDEDDVPLFGRLPA
jgi:hypothetical protein